MPTGCLALVMPCYAVVVVVALFSFLFVVLRSLVFGAAQLTLRLHRNNDNEESREQTSEGSHIRKRTVAVKFDEQ